jgi:hypothetical protein
VEAHLWAKKTHSGVLWAVVLSVWCDLVFRLVGVIIEVEHAVCELVEAAAGLLGGGGRWRGAVGIEGAGIGMDIIWTRGEEWGAVD